jgi:hypothetical protein
VVFITCHRRHPDIRLPYLEAIRWNITHKVVAETRFLYSCQTPKAFADAEQMTLEVTAAGESWDLTARNLSARDIEWIATAVVPSRVRTLLLSSNIINDAQTRSLCSAASQPLASLTVLDLSGNRIADDGASSLAHGLQGNSSLLDLNLSNNRITSTGAVALAQALAGNAMLQTLKFSGNRLDACGCDAILSALVAYVPFPMSIESLWALSPMVLHRVTGSAIELTHTLSLSLFLSTYSMIYSLFIFSLLFRRLSSCCSFSDQLVTFVFASDWTCVARAVGCGGGVPHHIARTGCHFVRKR